MEAVATICTTIVGKEYLLERTDPVGGGGLSIEAERVCLHALLFFPCPQVTYFSHEGKDIFRKKLLSYFAENKNDVF